MAKFANAPAPEAPMKFSELIKDMICLKPLSEGVNESEAYGTSEYTDCRVLRIDPTSGEWESLGTMWVFAQRVRGQLRNAADGSWIAGILTRNGQPYQLDPIPKDQIELVEAALTAFEDIEDF